MQEVPLFDFQSFLRRQASKIIDNTQESRKWLTMI
jgi:hypothetical protein